TFAMGTSVLIGLGVSSHVAGVNATATFDNVAVTATTTPPANVPPSVSLTSPTAGSTVTAPAAVGLGASAHDSDGAIRKADLYPGWSLLGTATSAPYTITWNGVAAGTYTLTAVATDNLSATTTSSAVTITVNPAAPPTGTLPDGWSDSDIGATG